MTSRWPIAVVTTGLLLVGCGDDGSSTPDARASTSTSTIDGGAPEATDDHPPVGDEGASGGPGTEKVGIGERVTVRVLDEHGDVVAGERP